MSCVSVFPLDWFHWVPSLFFDKDAGELWGVGAPLALRSLLASAPCINVLLDVEAQVHCFHVHSTMMKCLLWSLDFVVQHRAHLGIHSIHDPTGSTTTAKRAGKCGRAKTKEEARPDRRYTTLRHISKSFPLTRCFLQSVLA